MTEEMPQSVLENYSTGINVCDLKTSTSTLIFVTPVFYFHFVGFCPVVLCSVQSCTYSM